MPYIRSQLDRRTLNKAVDQYGHILLRRGYLNYFLCRLFLSEELSYNHAKSFIGELECAKLELYRRWIAEYEDKKKEVNGDVTK